MSDKRVKNRGLGRGLSALMADVAPEPVQADAPQRSTSSLPIEDIHPNPHQPRRSFLPGDLDELASSIAQKGVIQPLIVRPRAAGGHEIVAGERRWRAAQQAKLHELPVIVREFDDTEVLEIAIIENIQRADLNPIEEASGFRQLMGKFGHTQEKLAEALGKSRSYIANLLRLLNLPDDVQDLLRDGQISAGHARALVPARDPSALAQAVLRGGLSVRATEALVKSDGQDNTPKPAPRSPRASGGKDADTIALEGDLSAALGMRIAITHAAGNDGGEMRITYRDLDDLDRLCGLLGGN